MIVILVFIAAFLAFLVSSVAGGGAGLVLVPLLRLIVPAASIPGALSIGTATSSASRIYFYRDHIRWDIVRRFIPTALPAAGVGAWLLTCFEPVYVELLLGCFLLINLPTLFRKRAAAQTEQPLARGSLPWLGLAAGLISGFTGAVGVIFNRSYYRLGMSKGEIVATRAANEILLHLLKIALYGLFGLLPSAAIAAGVLVAVAAVLASAVSRPALAMIREAVFRRVGLLAMVVSGAAMFSVSTSEIMKIHQGWLAYVTRADEHELQIYWSGSRKVAFEIETDGSGVIEHAVTMERLPAPVRQALPAVAPIAAIELVEQVHGGAHSYYEVYFRRAGILHKAEMTPSGWIREVHPAA